MPCTERKAKVQALTDQLTATEEEHEEIKIEVRKVSAQRSSAARQHNEEQERREREIQERLRQVVSLRLCV